MSHIASHGKKTAWKAFWSNPDLLANLGNGDCHDETVKLAEQLICRINNLSGEDWCDNERVVMFGKCRLPEALPPTRNAPQSHMHIAHYQSMVWIQERFNAPFLPQQDTMGQTSNGKFVPTLMPLAPIAAIHAEFIIRGSTKGKCGCKTPTCTALNRANAEVVMYI